MDSDLRYPTGTFAALPESAAVYVTALGDLEELPARLREAVRDLSEGQLDTRYRPGGWTVRQVVHHLADSHMNGLIRTKLALTEINPTIKPYQEAEWAKLPDMQLPIDVSLTIVDAVHLRWVTLFRALAPAQRDRTFVHPEQGATMTLGHQLQSYAWHSRHHVAHIIALRQRQGW